MTIRREIDKTTREPFLTITPQDSDTIEDVRAVADEIPGVRMGVYEDGKFLHMVIYPTKT